MSINTTPNKANASSGLCRPYTADDNIKAAKVLQDAFIDDPIMHCLFSKTYMQSDDARGTFEYLLWVYGASFGMTELAVVPSSKDNNDEDDQVVCSAAMWEPKHASLGATVRTLFFLFWHFVFRGWKRTQRMARLLEIAETKRHLHVPQEHFHLVMIGTDSAQRGKGIGAKLIQVGLDRADQLGVPCYLESSNVKNVPFYKRFGFETMEEWHPFESDLEREEGEAQPLLGPEGDNKKGPVMTLMVRPAATKPLK